MREKERKKEVEAENLFLSLFEMCLYQSALLKEPVGSPRSCTLRLPRCPLPGKSETQYNLSVAYFFVSLSFQTYNVPAGTYASNPQNSQSVIAFEAELQYFSSEDLKQFFQARKHQRTFS